MKEEKMLELRKETFLTENQPLKEENDSWSDESCYSPLNNKFQRQTTSNLVNPADTVNENVNRVLKKALDAKEEDDDESRSNSYWNNITKNI